MVLLAELYGIELGAAASESLSPYGTCADVVSPSRTVQCSPATPTVLLLVERYHWIQVPAVSHWHGKHTECLQQVVEAAVGSGPDAAVGMHELDAPYVVGGADAHALRENYVSNLAMRPHGNPAHLHRLPREQGSAAQGPRRRCGRPVHVQQLAARRLTFVSAPSRAYPWTGGFCAHTLQLTINCSLTVNALSRHPHLAWPVPGSNLSPSSSVESIKTLADSNALHVFPSHDSATDVTGKQLKMFAMASAAAWMSALMLATQLSCVLNIPAYFS